MPRHYPDNEGAVEGTQRRQMIMMSNKFSPW